MCLSLHLCLSISDLQLRIDSFVVSSLFVCESYLLLISTFYLYGANGKKAVLLSQQKLGVPERGSR